MQNKAKVKMGKIKPIHVFARARSLTMIVYDFTRGNLPPYKGVLCKTNPNPRPRQIRTALPALLIRGESRNFKRIFEYATVFNR
jgi:hypothetical protein